MRRTRGSLPPVFPIRRATRWRLFRPQRSGAGELLRSPRENRASSNLTERHLLTLSYIYQLSFRKLVHKIADWANERERQGQRPSAARLQLLFRISENLLDWLGILRYHSVSFRRAVYRDQQCRQRGISASPTMPASTAIWELQLPILMWFVDCQSRATISRVSGR